MKHNKTITSAAFLLLGLGGLHAQESLAAAAGEATRTGATASYSVEQVVCITLQPQTEMYTPVATNVIKGIKFPLD
jgi:hypothetical protein